MGSNEVVEYENNCVRLLVKPEDNVGKMVHASLGMASEAGELLGAIKAHWIYGRELDVENVIEECGDALFYMSVLLRLVGSSLSGAMQHNIKKLGIRYPEGYTDEAAIAREDKRLDDSGGRTMGAW